MRWLVTVAYTVDGLDEGGICGVGFDFFAELGDVLVEGAAVGHVVVAPGVVVDVVAGEDLVGVVVEELEDFEVAQGEGDFGFVTNSAEFGGDDGEVVHLVAGGGVGFVF